MKNKRYKFADFCVELVSDDEISPSEQFDSFRSEEEPDISFRVICSALPEKSGYLLFSDEKRRHYKGENEDFLYSAYFDAQNGAYCEYSCRVTGEKGNLLFVDYERMWESMVFDALDIPDLLMKRKTAIIHSSYICVGDYALLFSADKQVGKSTQAALWEKFAGATVVNGDRAAIKEKNGTLYAFGVPVRGSSNISLSVDKPVRAIIILGQASENKIARLSPKEAFLGIIGKLTYDTKNQSEVEAASEIAAYAGENVPVYKYECLPDKSAVEFLKNELKI